MDILIGKSSALIQKSRYEAAAAYISRAIEIDAENAEVWNLRGDVLRWNSDHQDAIYSYQTAIDINSQLSQSHYGKGMSFYHLGRYGLAYKALKQSVNLNENFSDAYFHLGMTSYQLKYWDKANEAFTRFCELNPDAVRGLLHKGHTYRKRGDFSNTLKALNTYQEVLRKDPANLQALTCIGNVHLTLNEENSALEAFSKVATLNPNDQFATSMVWRLYQRCEERRLKHEGELEYKRERRQKKLEERRREKELKEMFEDRERSKRKWFGLF